MQDILLLLMPENKEQQEFVLMPHRLESSIMDAVHNQSGYVFCDCNYTAQLINVQNMEINNINFFVNGEAINIDYSKADGMIHFNHIPFGAKIFMECYGFVQLTIELNCDNRNLVLETDYIQVLVRKGQQNDSVQKMVEYVYKQDELLLYGKHMQPKEVVGLQENAKQTTETKILLLKRISAIFENNYPYFKTNSRFKIVTEEKIENFEKLQYVSNKTIQHIIQNPSELQRIYNYSGIKIGNYRYQPNKTLITNNTKSFDIYENRIIISFLYTLNQQLDKLENEIYKIILSFPKRPLETDEYITSSYFIYYNNIKALKNTLNDVRDLHNKFAELYCAYALVLPVKPATLYGLPKLTLIFRSISQYKQLYDCITLWFSMGAFSLQEEKYMLTFLKISSLYEAYILAKIIDFFQKNGYELEVREQKKYPPTGKKWLYENTICNNYFRFKNDTSIISLYYQPVIYNSDKRAISGIALYRNTSISFPNADGKSGSNYYYTPDYIIKYENSEQNGSRYLIADAKFSTTATVKFYQIAELVYKYLFSLSTFESEDSIIELCIFNGQSDKRPDRITNIYDFIHNPQSIMPRVEIVTLTENNENSESQHEQLFRQTIGRYITNISSNNSFFESKKSTFDNVNYEEANYNNARNELLKLDNELSIKENQNKTNNRLKCLLSDIKLNDDTNYILQNLGFTTVEDIVPNVLKSDLKNIQQLNRKQRREIEAKLKMKKIRLG